MFLNRDVIRLIYGSTNDDIETIRDSDGGLSHHGVDMFSVYFIT